jgi:hypothetical protein
MNNNYHPVARGVGRGIRKDQIGVMRDNLASNKPTRSGVFYFWWDQTYTDNTALDANIFNAQRGRTDATGYWPFPNATFVQPARIIGLHVEAPAAIPADSNLVLPYLRLGIAGAVGGAAAFENQPATRFNAGLGLSVQADAASAGTAGWTTNGVANLQNRYNLEEAIVLAKDESFIFNLAAAAINTSANVSVRVWMIAECTLPG